VATTLLSDIATASFVPASRPQGPPIEYPFSKTISSALAINDVIKLAKIPKGATLLAFLIDIPDLDTDASPTVSISVGDSGDLARFVATITTPRTAFTRVSSTASPTAATGIIGVIAGTLPRTYASNHDYLAIKAVAAATALSAPVTIKGWYRYTMFPTRKDFGQ
jgi:hypothetical protein